MRARIPLVFWGGSFPGLGQFPHRLALIIALLGAYRCSGSVQSSSLRGSALRSAAVMASLDLQLSLLTSGRSSDSTWVPLPQVEGCTLFRWQVGIVGKLTLFGCLLGFTISDCLISENYHFIRIFWFLRLFRWRANSILLVPFWPLYVFFLDISLFFKVVNPNIKYTVLTIFSCTVQ